MFGKSGKVDNIGFSSSAPSRIPLFSPGPVGSSFRRTCPTRISFPKLSFPAAGAVSYSGLRWLKNVTGSGGMTTLSIPGLVLSSGGGSPAAIAAFFCFRLLDRFRKYIVNPMVHARRSTPPQTLPAMIGVLADFLLEICSLDYA